MKSGYIRLCVGFVSFLIGLFSFASTSKASPSTIFCNISSINPAPASRLVGQQINISVSAGTQSGDQPIVMSLDPGDGSAPKVFNLTDFQGSHTFNHTYGNSGIFDITATCSDNGGGTDAAGAQITILDATPTPTSTVSPTPSPATMIISSNNQAASWVLQRQPSGGPNYSGTGDAIIEDVRTFAAYKIFPGSVAGYQFITDPVDGTRQINEGQTKTFTITYFQDGGPTPSPTPPPGAQCTLSPTPMSAAPGTQIDVSWVNSGTRYNKDWLVILPTGQGWLTYGGTKPWAYWNGSQVAPGTQPPASGSVSTSNLYIPNDAIAGSKYQVVYYRNDSGSDECGRSAEITVSGGDVTPPTGTIATIPDPLRTALGTIYGTASDNNAVASAVVVVRKYCGGGQVSDWNGVAWTTCGTPFSLTTTLTAPNSANTDWSMAITPPVGQMTAGTTYTVALLVTDAAGNTNNWATSQNFLYDPGAAPSASGVSIVLPDYCTSGPGGIISWTYSDPDGDAQSAYQAQISTNATFNGAGVVLDSGKISTDKNSYAIPLSTLQFNRTYYARVRVWDVSDTVSGWATLASCTGNGCHSSGTRWTTPQHAYPQNVSFTYSPNPAYAKLVTTFTDSTTVCYNISGNPTNCNTRFWVWGDGTQNNTGSATTTHTYVASGSYQATLQVRDSQNYTCPVPPYSQTVKVQSRPLPTYREVIPK